MHSHPQPASRSAVPPQLPKVHRIWFGQLEDGTHVCAEETGSVAWKRRTAMRALRAYGPIRDARRRLLSEEQYHALTIVNQDSSKDAFEALSKIMFDGAVTEVAAA